MSKDLTEEQKNELNKELEKLQKQMIEEAEKVRKDFKDNPSDENVTDISVDFDSPYLDEELKDDQWKKVVKPQYMEKFNNWLESEKKEKENKD